MKGEYAGVCNFSCLAFFFMLLLSEASFAQLHGKIFTSPEERGYLDSLRKDFLGKSQEAGFDIGLAGSPALPLNGVGEQAGTAADIEYTLGGILTRKDGSHTIWLNNQPIAEANLPENISLSIDGTLAVLRIATSSGSFTIKPGQTLNASTGDILEAYQRSSPVTLATDVPGTEIGTEAVNPSGIPAASTEILPAELPAQQAPAKADTREAP